MLSYGRGAAVCGLPRELSKCYGLGKVWARFRGLSSDEINAIATREIFAGLNARAALPKLQETILTWRPDLIVRESAEFAAAVAADKAGIRHVRVAVHNGRVEELFISMVSIGAEH